MTQTFIMIIALIFTGYILKRLNYIKEDEGSVIAKLIFNLTLPSLVIVTLSGVKINPSLIWLPVIMVMFVVIAKLSVIILFLKYNNQIRGSVGMMAGEFNIGLFAYPLVGEMFGAEGLLYFGMFDIGGSIGMFGITYFVGSYFSEGGDTFDIRYLLISLMKSVPLMTYIIMLSLNLLDLHLPDGIIEFFKIIAQANMPLSMILLGVYLNFKVDTYYLPLAIKYLCFHYGFGLIAGVICYYTLPFNEMFRTTLLIGWLLPIGVAIIPYAIQFKYNTLPLIAMISNLTIVISIAILYLFQMMIL
ncbi:AEC family transporter [Macrococcoides canis]|uniref:AEC family transporter n=1 Tax=Macrococcoides canis TaxID=1855823 RepID=UPI0010FC1C17|nr:AEC family transporter [Macrococcus canis]QCT73914.1 AEC family transporter [Macrococcus canis]